MDQNGTTWLNEPPLSVNFVPNIKGDTSYIDSVVSPASTWKNVGFTRPSKGRELTNGQLAATLMQQTSFAPEEWDAFGITDLCVNDFVRAGGCWYFQVVAVVGETVVPVPFSTRLVDDNDAHKCSSMWAAQKGVPVELQYSWHPVGVFFAGTDYGLQGATEPKLIVSAARKPFKPAVDMEGFYVFVSRVQRFANLRILELPSRHTCFYKRCNCPYKSEARLDNLLELRHDPELQVWNEGFGANGDWSIELARQTAGRVAAARAEAKQKAKPKAAAAAKPKAPSAAAAKPKLPTKRTAAPIAGTSRKCKAPKGDSPVARQAAPSASQPPSSDVPTKRDTAVAAMANEAVVERALNKLFSTGRDDVCFGELQRALLHSGAAMSTAAIDSALEAMEAANKVMHREGRVHLI